MYACTCAAPLRAQVWFQLHNALFPGGRDAITSTHTSPDAALAAEAAAWRADSSGGGGSSTNCP
jgi:hypothetical protein